MPRPYSWRGALWAGQRALALVIAWVVLARLALSVIAAMAFGMIPEQQGLHAVFHRTTVVALDVWARWDSEYYLDIAQHGYAFRSALTGFFPLYPMLIRLVAPFVADDWVLAGVVASFLGCVVALVYLYRLAAMELGEEAARRVALYVLIYPAALFLFAVYSESLYLALTVATFYHARRRQWYFAAVAAYLAGLARANALVLFLPLAYEAWEQLRAERTADAGLRPGRWRGVARGALGPVLAIGAAPIGLATFAAYLAWLTRDPLAYLHSQGRPPLARHLALPWVTLYDAARAVLGHLQDPTPLARAVTLQDFLVTLVLIAAAVIAWRRLPRVYAIYLIAATLFLLSSTLPDWPIQSMLRYSLTIFPLFLVLAQLGASRTGNRSIVIACAPLLGMYTALFAQWYWVF